jgi:hypothetical protein
MRKHIALIIMLLFIISSELYAQQYIRNTTVIDTPTAYTIARGSFQVACLGYDNGGLELKSFIGLHDNLFLGISFDMQNAIGKDDTKPNVPGVVAKLKFTDGWEQFPISFAIGYDSFYIGEQGKTDYTKNKLNRMIYGPYFVATKPVYLFDDEQHVHFGFRIPTQPRYVPGDTSYFLSIDVPFGKYFILKLEEERVYYDFHRPGEWLFNTGLKYSYQNHFGIEFDLLIQHDQPINRIVRVEYTDQF